MEGDESKCSQENNGVKKTDEERKNDQFEDVNVDCVDEIPEETAPSRINFFQLWLNLVLGKVKKIKGPSYHNS